MASVNSSNAAGLKAFAHPDLAIADRNTFNEIRERASIDRRCCSPPASPRDLSLVLPSAAATPFPMACGTASSSEGDQTPRCQQEPATAEQSTCGSASPLRWSDAESDDEDDLAALGLLSAPPSSPASAGGGRTPLSSKAQAWKSPALASPPAFGQQRLQNKAQNRFRQECEMAFEETRLALQLSGQCAEAQTSWQDRPDGGSACTLKVVLPAAAAPQRVATVQGLAQRSLIVASSRLSRVHLMGYLAAPFAQTAQGFVCTLGEMQEEKHACWDLYGQGFCCRGHSCRWQHALQLTTFTLVVAAKADEDGASLHEREPL